MVKIYQFRSYAEHFLAGEHWHDTPARQFLPLQYYSFEKELFDATKREMNDGEVTEKTSLRVVFLIVNHEDYFKSLDIITFPIHRQLP